MPELQTVPARRGAATVVKAGQKIKIINTHGNQVNTSGTSFYVVPV
jgi:uncharacterized protein